jgi:hypothetical protein
VNSKSLANHLFKGYQKALSFFDLRIHETIAIDDILARWNRCVAILKGRIENMKNRLMAKVESHSAEAERYGAEANGKLDSLGAQVGRIESNFDNLKDFIFDAVRKGMSGMSTESHNKGLQLQDTGAQAQTVFFHEMEEKVRNRDKEIEYLRQERQALSRERSNLFKIYERERENNDYLRRGKSPVPSQPVIAIWRALSLRRKFSPQQRNSVRGHPATTKHGTSR